MVLGWVWPGTSCPQGGALSIGSQACQSKLLVPGRPRRRSCRSPTMATPTISRSETQCDRSVEIWIHEVGPNPFFGLKGTCCRFHGLCFFGLATADMPCFMTCRPTEGGGGSARGRPRHIAERVGRRTRLESSTSYSAHGNTNIRAMSQQVMVFGVCVCLQRSNLVCPPARFILQSRGQHDGTLQVNSWNHVQRCFI